MTNATTPGWWLAADGNWYPSQPPAPKRSHWVRNVILASCLVFIGFVVLASAVGSPKSNGPTGQAAPSTTTPAPNSPYAITHEAMAITWDDETHDDKQTLCRNWGYGNHDDIVTQVEHGMDTQRWYYDRQAVVDFLNETCGS